MPRGSRHAGAEQGSLRHMFVYPIDSVISLILKGLAILLLLAFFAGSVAVWPMLITRCLKEGGASSAVLHLLIAGGAALAAGTIASLLCAWFDTDYGWKKSFAVSAIVSLVACYIAMAVLLVNPLGTGLVLAILTDALLGPVLCFVPAVIASVLGYLLRGAWYLINVYFR